MYVSSSKLGLLNAQARRVNHIERRLNCLCQRIYRLPPLLPSSINGCLEAWVHCILMNFIDVIVSVIDFPWISLFLCVFRCIGMELHGLM